MTGSLQQDLERAFHLIVSFTDDESFVEMDARAALRMIDKIADGEAFLSVRMKNQTMDLLRAGVHSAQAWRGRFRFVLTIWKISSPGSGSLSLLTRNRPCVFVDDIRLSSC